MRRAQEARQELNQVTKLYAGRVAAEQIPGYMKVVGTRLPDEIRIVVLFSSLATEYRSRLFRVHSSLLLEHPELDVDYRVIRCGEQDPDRVVHVNDDAIVIEAGA